MALAPVILVIAGTDSSGGAGIARDVATAACFGVSTALAVTAVTAQTHDRVLHVEPVPATLIARQVASAFAANSISAIKIGMLGTAHAARAVASTLKKQTAVPVVVDPVLAASSQDRLTRGDILEAILHDILPLATLITPNLAELAELTGGKPAQDDAQAAEQGNALVRLGAHAVLVKGGHAQGKAATDLLLSHNRAPAAFSHKRLNATMRGTGCTLSTAIAAHLAAGMRLDEAVVAAKRHVFGLLQNRTRR